MKAGPSEIPKEVPRERGRGSLDLPNAGYSDENEHFLSKLILELDDPKICHEKSVTSCANAFGLSIV